MRRKRTVARQCSYTLFAGDVRAGTRSIDAMGENVPGAFSLLVADPLELKLGSEDFHVPHHECSSTASDEPIANHPIGSANPELEVLRVSS